MNSPTSQWAKPLFSLIRQREISSSFSKAVDFERIDIWRESKETLTLITINYSKWRHLKTQHEYATSTPTMNAQFKKCCRLHLKKSFYVVSPIWLFFSSTPVMNWQFKTQFGLKFILLLISSSKTRNTPHRQGQEVTRAVEKGASELNGEYIKKARTTDQLYCG